MQEVQFMVLEDRFNEQIELFRNELKRDPEVADLWNSLGLGYCQLGQYSEAIDAYRKAIAIEPKEAILRYNLGCAFDDHGRYPAAIST